MVRHDNDNIMTFLKHQIKIKVKWKQLLVQEKKNYNLTHNLGNKIVL